MATNTDSGSEAVTAIAWSPDGSLLASTGITGVIRIRNGTTLEIVSSGWGPYVRCRDGSANSNPVDLDEECPVSSIGCGSPPGPWQATAATAPVYALKWCGDRIATGSCDGKLRIWNSNDLSAPLATSSKQNDTSGNAKAVRTLAFSPNCDRIVTGSDNFELKTWDALTLTLHKTSGPGRKGSHSRAVRSVAYSPDGSRIVSAGQDEHIRAWDASHVDLGALHLITPFSYRFPDWTFNGGSQTPPDVMLAYSPDGTTLATGDWATYGGTTYSGIRLFKIDFVNRLLLSGVLVKNNEAASGGAVAVYNPPCDEPIRHGSTEFVSSASCRAYVEMQSSTLRGNEANVGGALLLVGDAEQPADTSTAIEDCVFADNSAKLRSDALPQLRGAAIAASDCRFDVSGSLFTGSSGADPGKGSAVYYTGAVAAPTSTFATSNFTNNTLDGSEPTWRAVSPVDWTCNPGQYMPRVGIQQGDWWGCTSCLQGYYGNASTATNPDCTVPGQTSVDTRCPRGSYCPEGSVIPTPCDPGTILPADGAANASSCVTCAPGSYSNISGNGNDACDACPAGRFAELGGSTRCDDCQEGGYCALEGQASALMAWLACPAGTIGNATGLTSVEQCLACPSGHFCYEGRRGERTEPQPCPRGTYNPSSNGSSAASCIFCPEGTFNANRSGADLGSCVSCEAGKFNPMRGGRSEAACQASPKGSYAPPGASESIACAAGRFGAEEGMANETCSGECAAGHYCEEGSVSAKAAACAEGSYGNGTGLRSQANCTACPMGHACPEAARGPTACRPGTAQPNASQGACVDCVAGTFMNHSEATSCFGCPEGSHCAMGSSTPLPCSGGSFGNATGLTSQDECHPCPPGHFCFAGSVEASECGKGTYAMSERSQLCTACEEGKYQNSSGTTACMECGDGYICDEGSVARIPARCEAGFFLNATLAAMVDDPLDACLQCPAGSFCTGDSSPARECTPGSYAPRPGMALCALCPAGQYQGGVGAEACESCTLYSWCSEGSSAPTPCATGTVGSLPGLISADQCDACPPGFWCSAGVAIACGASTYSDAVNATNEGTCTPCPANSRSPSGSTSIDVCTCNEAFYDKRPAMGELECELCPVGSECDGNGATLESLPVLDGYYRTSGLSNDLLECPTIGGVTGSARCRAASSDGNSTCVDNLSGVYCTACPPDHYLSAEGDNVCVPCGGMSDATLLVYVAVCAATLLLVAVVALSARPSFGGSRSGRVALTQRLAVLTEASGLGSKLKQLVSFYQMATSIQSAFIITYPEAVRRLLSVFELFSLNLFELGLPLECMGLASFMTRLTFMMIAPLALIVLALPLSLFLMLRRRDEWRSRGVTRAVLLYVLPMVLKLLFVVFPLVSAVAVQAFDCQQFDNGEFWLRADYNVKCGDVVNGTVDCTEVDCTELDVNNGTMHRTDEYARIESVGALAILLYPIGVPLLFLGLLISCRKQLSRQAPSTPLSSSLAFLCAEYRKRFFVWEAIESVKKIFFVSLVRLVKPGTLSQLLLALLVALGVSWYTVQAAPFKRRSDNFLAVLSGGAYCLMLLGALTLKLGSIYETLLDQDKLSPELENTFEVPSQPVLVVLLCSTLAAITFSVVILMREALRDMRQPKLRYTNTHTLVAVPLPTGKTHHLFISHVWSTAQDQARVLRQMLQSVAPGLRVWLDVEDLTDISALEEAVDSSWTLLILVTAGYFQSKNCMRELVRCVATDTPRIAVVEREAEHGGLTEAEARQQCVAAGAKFASWGFDANGPTADALADALLGTHAVGDATVGTPLAAGKPGVADDGEPIVYERVGVFQQPMLRLIVQRLVGSREIYLPGELRVSRHAGALAPPVRTHHIWCSRHNPGALEVVNELKHAGGYEGRLLVTEEPGAMAEADHVLLYLSLATWADDDQRKTALTAEIKGVLQAGRKLLLLHETDEERGGVQQFGHFFGADQTPGELLRLKIYAEIAIGMKAGAYRTVSLGLFDQVLKAGGGATRRASWLNRSQNTLQGQQAPAFTANASTRRRMKVLAMMRFSGGEPTSSTKQERTKKGQFRREETILGSEGTNSVGAAVNLHASPRMGLGGAPDI